MISKYIGAKAFLTLGTWKGFGFCTRGVSVLLTCHCQSYICCWTWSRRLFNYAQTPQGVNMAHFTLSLSLKSTLLCLYLMYLVRSSLQGISGRLSVLFFDVLSPQKSHRQWRGHHYRLRSGTGFFNMMLAICALSWGQHPNFRDLILFSAVYQTWDLKLRCWTSQVLSYKSTQ